MQEGALPLERMAMLIRGLRHAGVCMMYQDLDLRVRLVENPFECWPEERLIFEGGDGAIFYPASTDHLRAAKRLVARTAQPQKVEARAPGRGFDCWFEISIEPDVDDGGKIRGLFVAAVDITEHKKREETLRRLLAEVSHRSRNLLAIVQSILGQTMRLETDPLDFATKLRGRIQALAITQDLVTHANWQGAQFRHLAYAQLDPFTEPADYRLQVRGADPQLDPNVALHVGLALHELAANSAKFGTLARRQGEIDVSMTARDGRLLLEWCESHGDTLPPGNGKFGTAVLSHILPQATGGHAAIRMAPGQVWYRLELPEQQA